MEVLPLVCERARTWASLRADGELSELEDALLDAHLGRCAECTSFARGFAVVASALRASDPVEPVPVALPRRRFRAAYAVAAAVAVLAAVLGLLLAAPSGPQRPKPVAMVAANDSPDRLRELRRPVLIQQARNARAAADSV